MKRRGRTDSTPAAMFSCRVWLEDVNDGTLWCDANRMTGSRSLDTQLKSRGYRIQPVDNQLLFLNPNCDISLNLMHTTKGGLLLWNIWAGSYGVQDCSGMTTRRTLCLHHWCLFLRQSQVKTNFLCEVVDHIIIIKHLKDVWHPEHFISSDYVQKKYFISSCKSLGPHTIIFLINLI